jgi:hypothetical protein
MFWMTIDLPRVCSARADSGRINESVPPPAPHWTIPLTFWLGYAAEVPEDWVESPEAELPDWLCAELPEVEQAAMESAIAAARAAAKNFFIVVLLLMKKVFRCRGQPAFLCRYKYCTDSFIWCGVHLLWLKNLSDANNNDHLPIFEPKKLTCGGGLF